MSFRNVLNNPTRLLKSVASRVTLVAMSHGLVMIDASDDATLVNGSEISVHSDVVCTPPAADPPLADGPPLSATPDAGGVPPCSFSTVYAIPGGVSQLIQFDTSPATVFPDRRTAPTAL